jgi:hypothetical protein
MNHFLRFGSPVLSSFLPSSLLFALLAAATGCSVTTEGADGHATFSYDSLGSMSVPLAAGASDGITASVPSGTTVDHATSSNTAVLTIGTMTTNSAGGYDFPVTGGNPGSSVFTIYDPTGKVIDQTTVEVAATTSITLSTPSGLTLLEGQSYAVHATTIGAGGATLAGSGAIHFAYTGSLASAAPTNAFCTGDCGYFTATTAGDGEANVTALSASAPLQLHVVPASAIDTLSFASATLSIAPNGVGSMAYTLKSSGTIVYTGGTELTCTSSNATVAASMTQLFGSTLATSTTTGSIAIGSGPAGTATITCSVGGQQASFDVTVQ